MRKIKNLQNYKDNLMNTEKKIVDAQFKGNAKNMR